MKLIIDIDEDIRIAITRMGLLRITDEMKKKVDKAIQLGKPLPKGHGDLIDRNKLLRFESMWYHLPNGDVACPKIDIDNAPTIIEADKESEDKG